MCNSQQTTENLLFKCHYVKPLWRVVESLCNVQVGFEAILEAHGSSDYDNLITIVSFIIYKEWLAFPWRMNQRVELLFRNTLKTNCQLVLKFMSHVQDLV